MNIIDLKKSRKFKLLLAIMMGFWQFNFFVRVSENFGFWWDFCEISKRFPRELLVRKIDDDNKTQAGGNVRTRTNNRQVVGGMNLNEYDHRIDVYRYIQNWSFTLLPFISSLFFSLTGLKTYPKTSVTEYTLPVTNFGPLP